MIQIFQCWSQIIIQTRSQDIATISVNCALCLVSCSICYVRVGWYSWCLPPGIWYNWKQFYVDIGQYQHQPWRHATGSGTKVEQHRYVSPGSPAGVDTVPSPGVDIVQVVSPGGGYQLLRPWPGRGTVGWRCTIAPWGSPLLLPGCKLEPGETQQTEASYGNQ